MTIHLDYDLKKTVGYTPDIDKNAQHSTTSIPNYGSYDFSYTDGITTDTQTIQNENVFKHDPGFAGIVPDSNGNPVESVKVQIYSPDGKLLATVYTDEDGWYMYHYKHTGKVATYTIKCGEITKTVTLKANQIVQMNFTI